VSVKGDSTPSGEIDGLQEVDIDDLDDAPMEATVDERVLPEDTVDDGPVPGSAGFQMLEPPEGEDEERPTGDMESEGFDAVESLFEDNVTVIAEGNQLLKGTREANRVDVGDILPTIKDRTTPPVAAAAVQITADGARPVGVRLTTDEELVELPPSDDPDLDNRPEAEGGFHFDAEEVEYEEEDAEEGGAHAPKLTPDEGYAAFHDGSRELSDDEISEVEEVDADELDSLQEQASQALDRGDLNAAAMAYSALLEMDPSNLGAYLGRGRCYLDLGDYAAAMSDFQKAEDLDPEGPESLVAMGELFFARKEYSRAIEFFDQAIELDNSHAMARCRRGISYYYKKSYRQAFLDLQKAYTLDPEIPNIRKYVQMAIKKLERSGDS